MASTAGYYLFGGGVDDYARAYGTDTLLPNTALTITDPASGAALIDLLDSTANPDSTITTDANGEFKFWARIPVVNIQPVGGNTYQVIAKSALVQAALSGNLSQQVAAAQAAAQQAANAASSAAASAAASVPNTARGVASGVATLDSTGKLPVTQASQDVLDRLDSLQAAIEGAVAGVREHQEFLFDATTTPPSLAPGVRGRTFVSPGVDTLLDQVYMELDDFSATVATSFDVQFLAPPYSGGFVSCYAASFPTIPVNAKSAFGLAAPSPAIPARSIINVLPVTVAPQRSVSGTPAALKGAQGTYSTGSGTASSHALTMPSGAATGDIVIVAFTCPAGSTASMPVAWGTPIVNITEPGTNNRVRLMVWAVAWSNTLVPTVTTTSGTNGIGWIRLISGSDATQIVATTTSGYQVGASFAGPADPSAPIAADLLIELNGVDIPNPLTVVTGQTWTGGPSGLTKDYDAFTTRTSVRNGAMGVGHASGVAAGANVTADTFTENGAASNTSWCAARLYIPRGAGVHGPNRAQVQIDLVSA